MSSTQGRRDTIEAAVNAAMTQATPAPPVKPSAPPPVTLGVVIIDADTGAIAALDAEAQHLLATPSESDLVGRRLHDLLELSGKEPWPESGQAERHGRRRAWAGGSDDEKRELIYCLDSLAIGGHSFRSVTLLDPAPLETLQKEKGFLETELARAQKMESIGALAAGIAHEINTPTQYVGDNTRFLKDAFADLTALLRVYERLHQAVQDAPAVPAEILDQVNEARSKANIDYLTEEIPQAIDQSLEGIERVTRIVRAMKEFSHPGSEEKVLVDLNRAIRTTVTVTRNEWKYVADVELELEEDLPLVPGLPGELNQVLLNLVVNAAQAIGEKASNGAQGKGTITLRTHKTPGSVQIDLSDTGTGIPAAIREKIFKPFFTTKPLGKGTGQGLAIVRSVIVEKHGGRITAESEEGVGTTFHITLPRETREGPAGD